MSRLPYAVSDLALESALLLALPHTPLDRSATRTSSTTPVGLPISQLVGTIGGGLLTVVVDAGPATVDDVTLAEPGSGVYGQSGDLLLGVGVDRPAEAAALLEGAASVGSGAVVLRRVAARSPQVRAAASRFGVGLVELADHASWAHVVWLLRGVLDRAAERPVPAGRGAGARRALRPRGRLRDPRRRADHHRGHRIAGARLLLDPGRRRPGPGLDHRRPARARRGHRLAPGPRGLPPARPLRPALLRPCRAGPGRSARRARAGRHRVARLDLGRRRRRAPRRRAEVAQPDRVRRRPAPAAAALAGRPGPSRDERPAARRAERRRRRGRGLAAPTAVAGGRAVGGPRRA